VPPPQEIPSETQDEPVPALDEHPPAQDEPAPAPDKAAHDQDKAAPAQDEAALAQDPSAEPSPEPETSTPPVQTAVEPNPLSDEVQPGEESGPDDDKQPLMKNHENGESQKFSVKNYTNEADEDFNFESSLSKFAPLIVLGYILLSVLVFALIEGFDFTTAFYYVAISITTVGYGDVSPADNAGKITFIVFILLGLSIIGFAMGVLVAESAKLTDRERSPWEECLCGFLEDTLGLIGTMIFVNLLILAAIAAVGTVFLVWVEEFDTLDGLYWSVATFTTVGYGDLSLSEKPGTRWFFIIYAFVAVPTAGSLVGGFAAAYIEQQQKQKLKKVIKSGVTPAMIKAMDIDGDNSISRDEFLGFMLLKLNRCDPNTLDTLFELYDMFDADGSGELSKEDIVEHKKKMDALRATNEGK